MTIKTTTAAASPAAANHRVKHHFFYAVIFLWSLAVAMPLSHAATFKALHHFDSPTDAAEPLGSVIRDAAGNIYGTTVRNDGTVFKIDSKGNESILFLFSDFFSGTFPTGSLTQDQAGNLYGVAEGGPGGAGVVYKLSPQGEQQVLFAFQGGLHNHTPKLPAGGVLLGKAGNLFGTAQFGDNQACVIGCGSLFRLNTDGTFHFLYRFTGAADGGNPIGPLVQDSKGNLYGVAQSGGDLQCEEFFLQAGTGCGVVFKLDRNRNLTVLHTFKGRRDGAIPQGGLLLDSAGNLFGTTLSGGRHDHGTLFEISADGTYTVLHRLTGAEGINPNGGLVSDPVGNLYGTAQLGGAHHLGTVFEFTPAGQVIVLHSFGGLKDGAAPFAGLFRDEAGHLYGTTAKDFLFNHVQGGNVFEITP